MKRIGIDARFYGSAGHGRYIKNVITSLEKLDFPENYEIYIFLNKKGFDQYYPKSPKFKKILADFMWYSFAEQTSFLWLLLKSRLTVLYVPHFNIPVLYPFKLILTIHDLIMHDFTTEKGTTLPKYYFRIKKIVYPLVVAWSLMRATKILVPSKFVEAGLNKEFNSRFASKLVYATEGIDADFTHLLSEITETDCAQSFNQLQKEFHISDEYLLYIGNMYEHKNLHFLIESFAKFKHASNFTGDLIIVGKNDKFASKLQTWLNDKGYSEYVKLPGIQRYITDKETLILRKKAKVYVTASLMEGFGLTPLEAQACALPCLISDIPIHREIFGNSVMLFDPKNSDDFVTKLTKIINNEDSIQALIKAGKENLLRYSWDDTGIKLKQIIMILSSKV